VDPTTKESATATTAPKIPLDVVLLNPADGTALKRISIDDARFNVPGFSARVQQKLDVTVNWQSDQGDIAISKS
jgi:hypothetical protein